MYDSLTLVTSEMRQTQPPFAIKEVRQAMNYAIDKEAIVETIMSGLGRVADSPAPPGVWGAATFPPYEYDPEKPRNCWRPPAIRTALMATSSTSADDGPAMTR